MLRPYLSNHNLVGAEAVKIGGVEESDTFVESMRDQILSFGVASGIMWAISACKAHTSQALC